MLVFTTLTLSGCSSKEEQPTANIQPKHFLKQHDGSDSKVFVDCRKNSDCKIEPMGCGSYTSVNVNNTEEDMYKYEEKEHTLVLYNCSAGHFKTTDYKAICSNNVCQATMKPTSLLSFIFRSILLLPFKFISSILN